MKDVLRTRVMHSADRYTDHRLVQVGLEERLHCVTDAEPEEQWKQMKIVAEVVGLLTREKQDWFDEADKEIQELLEKKCPCCSSLFAKPDE